MKFLALWTLKQNVDANKITEAIRRRAEYQFPEGVKLLAEYWTPRNDPASVSLFEANDVARIVQCSMYWSEFFTVDIIPVEEWQSALNKLASSKRK